MTFKDPVFITTAIITGLPLLYLLIATGVIIKWKKFEQVFLIIILPLLLLILGLVFFPQVQALITKLI